MRCEVLLLVVLHLLHAHTDGVGHLVVERPQDLLADELGHDHLHAAGRSPCRAGTRPALPAAGRPTSSTKASTFLPVSADEAPPWRPTRPGRSAASRCADSCCGVRQVGLGQHADLLRARRARAARPPIRRRGRWAWTSPPTKATTSTSSRALQCRDVQLLAQGVVRLVQARRVHDDHLEAGAREHGAEPVPRGLHRVGGDGDLLAHDGVQKRRLARVRAADERDEARPEAFFAGNVPPSSWFCCMSLIPSGGISPPPRAQRCGQEHRGRHGQSRERAHEHGSRRAVLRPPRQFANIRATPGRPPIPRPCSGIPPRTRAAMHRITAAHDAPSRPTRRAERHGHDGHGRSVSSCCAACGTRTRARSPRTRRRARARTARPHACRRRCGRIRRLQQGSASCSPSSFACASSFTFPSLSPHGRCTPAAMGTSQPAPRRGLMPLRPSRRASPTPPGSRPRASP